MAPTGGMAVSERETTPSSVFAIPAEILQQVGDSVRRLAEAAPRWGPGIPADVQQQLARLFDGLQGLMAAGVEPARELIAQQRQLADTMASLADLQRQLADQMTLWADQQRRLADGLTRLLAPLPHRKPPRADPTEGV